MLHVYIYIYVTCLCYMFMLHVYVYVYIYIFSVCASMYMTYLCAIDKATHIRMHHTQRSSLAWQGASTTLRQRQGYSQNLHWISHVFTNKQIKQGNLTAIYILTCVCDISIYFCCLFFKKTDSFQHYWKQWGHEAQMRKTRILAG
jgi:hypothetical protein